ncbi:MAG: hypothetical protein M1474_03010 [Candidatus Marsarchaeota archaeon]|jgi:hypothetical protein|nr:hypothetical protein [Candidatus Marsarchaeota archaeon]
MASAEQGTGAGYAAGNAYLKITDMIAKIEASAAGNELGFLDITGIVGTELERPRRSYADLLGFIAMIESKRPLEMQRKPEEARVMAQQPQPTGPQMVAQATQTGQGPTIKLPEYPGLEEAMKKQPQPEEDEAKPGKKQKKGRERIDTSNLVLPTLDPKDQITELERIIEGLRQGIFDKEHLGVVVTEIYGLKQVADDQRRAKKGAQSTVQRSAASVRDKLIAEAIVLLHKQK